MSSVDINAVSPLFRFNKLLVGNDQVELTSFKSDGENVSGSLKAADDQTARQLEQKLSKSSLKNIKVNQKNNSLSFSFTYEE